MRLRNVTFYLQGCQDTAEQLTELIDRAKRLAEQRRRLGVAYFLNLAADAATHDESEPRARRTRLTHLRPRWSWDAESQMMRLQHTG